MTRPPYSAVLPGLVYLGRARKAARLRAAGVRSIVNISGRRYDGRRRNLPLAEGYNDPRKILAVVACLERRLQRKQVPIYLHCIAGRNRSPIVAAVFLVKRRRFRSFGQALKFVRHVHPATRPLPGMLASGRTAVLMLGGKE
jgi:hypothetical protein